MAAKLPFNEMTIPSGIPWINSMFWLIAVFFPVVFSSSSQNPHHVLWGDWKALGSSALRSLHHFCHWPKSYGSSPTWGVSHPIPWLLLDCHVLPAQLCPTSFGWRFITVWCSSILSMLCELEIWSLIAAIVLEKGLQSCPVLLAWLGSHRVLTRLAGGEIGKMGSLVSDRAFSLALCVLSSSRMRNTCLGRRQPCC